MLFTRRVHLSQLQIKVTDAASFCTESNLAFNRIVRNEYRDIHDIGKNCIFYDEIISF